MHNGNVWELAFDEPAVLQLQAEFGNLSLLPVEPGQRPRLELARGSGDGVDVQVDKVDAVVRVRLEPRSSFNWFGGGWDCRAVLYVPRDVRAAVQTSAGSVTVRGLQGCDLGVKASAGKIELVRRLRLDAPGRRRGQHQRARARRVLRRPDPGRLRAAGDSGPAAR